jgi:hypothetical protein
MDISWCIKDEDGMSRDEWGEGENGRKGKEEGGKRGEREGKREK